MENSSSLNQKQIVKANFIQKIIFKSADHSLKIFPLLWAQEKKGKFGQNSIIPKICEIENCGKEFSCKQAYAGHVKSHKSRKIPPEVLQEMKSIQKKEKKINSSQKEQEMMEMEIRSSNSHEYKEESIFEEEDDI